MQETVPPAEEVCQGLTVGLPAPLRKPRRTSWEFGGCSVTERGFQQVID